MDNVLETMFVWKISGIISWISFQAKANSSSVAKEDKRKAPERGTSYEENAVDKKILEKIPVRRKK